MRLARAASIAALATFVAGCGREIPTQSDARVPGLLPPASVPGISDGAHAGNTGFYFLPPLVANPTYTGVFDAGLSPEVQICRLGATGCDGAPIAVYTTTTGPGSETVRVGAASDH